MRVKTTPIAANFEFDIALPPKPSETALFVSSVVDAPGNTIDIPPILTPDLEQNRVHVLVPLAGAGVGPLEVYARHINVGWAFPTQDLHHLRVRLDKMILYEDKETDPADADLAFSWLNINLAPSAEWQRLSDFDVPTDSSPSIVCPGENTLEDYDDAHGCGMGELNFAGLAFNFYVANGQPVEIRTVAYEQDCLDLWFGYPVFALATFLDCFASLNATGDNDSYAPLRDALLPPDYRDGTFDVLNRAGEFRLFFTVEDRALVAAEINDMPIAQANGPYAVAEGEAIVLSSLGSHDADGSVTAFQWDLQYDGLQLDVDATGPSPTFSAAELDGPAVRTVALRVIDSLGVTALSTATINMLDAPPTVFVTGDSNGVRGQRRSFTVSATDPSAKDRAAGYRFSVDFGDGTPTETVFGSGPVTLAAR